MINEITFKNLKCFQDMKLELEPLTVLIGPNASGKTTILESIHFFVSTLQRMYPDDLKGTEFKYDHNFHSFNLRDSRNRIRHSLDLYQQQIKAEGLFYFKLTGLFGNKPGWFEFSQQMDKETNKSELRSQFEWQSINSSGKPTLNEVQQYFHETGFSEQCPKIIFLRFDSSQLAAPAFVERAKPVLYPNGYGLAEVLAYMKQRYENSFSAIVGELKSLVPVVENISIDRVDLEGRVASEILISTSTATDLSARNASEGTLFLLGLLTILSGIDGPVLILIDELEHSLHPKALKELVGYLRAATKTRDNLQIIATTYSPVLLDFFNYEEIRMTYVMEDGAATCAKLTEHPNYKLWKDEMFPGEFWNAVGEDWIKDRA